MAKNVSAISVENLTKRFGKTNAVDNVSFSVVDGEIFGLLGPNGAGKTTLISMLTTAIGATSGTIKFCGEDIAERGYLARKEIGVVFQEHSLDEELTAYENLDFHARLYKVRGDRRRSINGALGLVDLEAKAHVQVKNFSGGMKRRLEIARSFVHRPKILFLDEPTIGLDVQSRRKLWGYIGKLNRHEGMTVFLTTHYLEEADSLCARIAIIDSGRIAAIDSPSGLKRRYRCRTLDDVFLKLAGHGIEEETASEQLAGFAMRRMV